ncbi:hypothetical protein [Faecalibaculum rodentium]|uniref:hypothetical protein n=1 Tax=Faecalibaculum rodentium TaxID=1702221 RepID=UPI0023F19604|nr:hypothetical protein [Faecalibaculum rodentium]
MGDKLIRVELDHAAMAQLLKREELQDVLLNVAESRIPHDGGVYEAEKKVMPGRAIAVIKPGDAHTYYKNLKTNSLLKAVK